MANDCTDRIPISIISNSYLLCEGLVALLEPFLPVELVGTYLGEMHFDESLPNPQEHLALLDSGIGRERAISWTRFWRSRQAPARVVLLEVEDEADFILACIEAGASGYTLRGAQASEVAEVIQQAWLGMACCSPHVMAQVFARLESLGKSNPSRNLPGDDIPLTPRELEVLYWISKGLSNKEIAAKLYIAIHTVKHHVHNILEKLNSSRRYEAVRIANEQGWLNV